MLISIRNTKGDVLIEGESESEQWQTDATRLYNHYAHKGRKQHPRYSMALSQKMAPSTWHVQFGYKVGNKTDGPVTLDDLVVIQLG